jgi:hypothetical protein
MQIHQYQKRCDPHDGHSWLGNGTMEDRILGGQSLKLHDRPRRLLVPNCCDYGCRLLAGQAQAHRRTSALSQTREVSLQLRSQLARRYRIIGLFGTKLAWVRPPTRSPI